ncbi:hypothetical protein ACEPAF_7128 [Sanghuangporus sanghuang]
MASVKELSTVPSNPPEEFSLDGRVAVVAGGGRGLELEISQALAEAGATIYCLAQSSTPSERDSSYISRLKAIWFAMDEIAKKEGRLDICVASAGIVETEPRLEIAAERFERIVVDVNVNGIFYTAQAAARQMKKSGRAGSIVLVTSIGANVALQGTQTVSYCITKAAGIQMARSLGMELSQYGIRVNSLSPGYMLTGFDDIDI